MGKNDPRKDRDKREPLEHHSSRGRVPRNNGNFTRGSQLIGHQVFMFLAGAKVPFLMWLVSFVVVYWIMLAAAMGEHEFQLCTWRIGAALWGFMEFDPFKPMNIVLADDSVRQVSIGYIPYLPDVKIAWAKAIHALVGALIAASLFALPLIWWFINLANKRGSTILQERHERGAMLVDRDVLQAEILAHNELEFEKSARRLFPDLTPQQVLSLSLLERKAGGLHHPYSIAGIPYPYGLESSHTILVGTTGAGKTTQLRSLVAEMRKRRDSAVVFDLTGAFIEAFYDERTDVILNPGDKRCPSWSIFEECSTQAEFTAAAQALVPHDGGGSDPFWVLAARMLFVQMCLKLQEHCQTSNRALAENLMTADLKRVHRILQDTTADPLTAPEAARMAESIRAVFNTNAEALMCLPEDGELFSIREWVKSEDKPGSILFVSARHVDLPLYKALLTLWLDLSVNTLMTLPRTRALRTWFLFDELGALHRLPAIENGLQTARGFGGAFVLGLHSIARLQAVYGREGAENLTSLARTKLILTTADRKTAETCAEFIGSREVRQMDEAYSYGYNNLRDASTLTPKKEVAPLVMADDINELPSLHGFVKFPDGFPAARVVLKWRDFPQVALGFDPREVLPKKRPGEGNAVVPPRRPRPKPSGGNGGSGEAGGRESAPDKSFTQHQLGFPDQSAHLLLPDAERRQAALAAGLAYTTDKPVEETALRSPSATGEANNQPPVETDQRRAIEQADKSNASPPTADARAGMIERPASGQSDERFEATMRELSTDFGDGIEPGHDHDHGLGDD